MRRRWVRGSAACVAAAALAAAAPAPALAARPAARAGGAAGARAAPAAAGGAFARYCAEHGKAYGDPAEYELRRSLFERRAAAVVAHNAARAASHTLSVNHLSDWTEDELRGLTSGYKRDDFEALPTQVPFDEAEFEGDDFELPEEFDWRDAQPSVVTAVKNQGHCGSCWAFSATETLESAVALSGGGELFNASTQEFVSCVRNKLECGGTGGCGGATARLAFDWAVSNGITPEGLYPYTQTTGTCETAKLEPKAGITGFVALPRNKPNHLARALVKHGPISVTVAAARWAPYGGGVYNDTDECGFDLDHLVQLVGYGTDAATGQRYWTIRNSWGPTWGEGGYIRLAREAEGDEPAEGVDTSPQEGYTCKGGPANITVKGVCGLYSDSAYPTGAYMKTKAQA